VHFITVAFFSFLDMIPIDHERLSSLRGPQGRANGKAVKFRRGRAAVKDIFGRGPVFGHCSDSSEWEGLSRLS
jgi:hypothetical protein